MDAVAQDRILNSAVTQTDRMNGAPDPDGVRVDGRTLAQLLVFASKYGALIRFYDVADAPDGDWSAFFSGDPSIALALIASLDMSSIREGLSASIGKLNKTTGSEQRKKALERPVTVILWLKRLLDQAQATAAVNREMAQAVRQDADAALAGSLQRFTALTGAYASQNGILQTAAGGSSDLWQLPDASAMADLVSSASGFCKLISLLLEAAASLTMSLEQLSALARSCLDATLEAEGHTPQAALYDTFVQLFQEAQQAVNNFPRRMTEFYYRTILQQETRGGTPDRLWLAFTTADGVSETSVSCGTRFSAGADGDGAEVVYATERALTVRSSELSALRTLRVTQEPLILFEPKPRVSTLRTGRVLCGTATLADAPPVLAQPVPPFGATETGTDGVLVSDTADLGIALAGPIFLLGGGTRKVTLNLTLDAAGVLAAQPLLKEIGSAIGEDDPLVVLGKILNCAFRLRYSTAEGFASVESYSVNRAGETSQSVFALTFTLQEDMPAFAALGDATEPDFAGMAAGTSLLSQPVLQLLLIQERVNVGAAAGNSAGIYPYAVLSRISVTHVSVDADVSGFSAVSLSGPDGELDPSQPFVPFGSPPVCGNALRISARELFAKPLGTLNLRINWQGIPTCCDGFCVYYKNYIIDLNNANLPTIENRSFRCSFALQNSGFWAFDASEGETSSEGESSKSVLVTREAYLFRTEATSKTITSLDYVPGRCLKLESYSSFSLKLQVSDAPSGYDPDDGGVLLTLSNPTFAFGDTIYAKNLEKASLITLNWVVKKLSDPLEPHNPNPPWLPVVSSLTLSYKAQTDYRNRDNLELYYLLPFGAAEKIPSEGTIALLPKFEDQGDLFIGLSPAASGADLLLELSAPTEIPSKLSNAPVWSQKTPDGWTALSAENGIANDGTNEFRNSGIVRFENLSVSSGEETLWLRLGVASGAETFPELIGIQTNSVTASWVGPGGAATLGTPLPAGSVTTCETDLDEIGEVLQPGPSFGGRPQLQGRNFTMWMAERLRHKDRGVDMWDYARLALDADPELWQAAVCPAADGKDVPEPGSVRLVVVPGPDAGTFPDPTVPLADAVRLRTLQETLQTRISPFITLDVVNPTYVRIAVTAKLIFGDDDTVSAGIARLNAELIAWLSPWSPPASLGIRPDEYYSLGAIGDFLNARPYVRGVSDVSLSCDPPTENLTWFYLTSAKRHNLSGETE